MFGFPRNTDFNKRIPKQKFYENISVSPELKRVFVEQIKTITWKSKLATSTINIAAGESVTEIEVFEIKLTSAQLDESVLRQIDREIPYHIIFILACDDKYQAWVCFKETAASGTAAFKVGKYYHTEWMQDDQLMLKIEGLNMDAVYAGLVRQIAGDALQSESGEALKETVQRAEQRQSILRQIETLERKIRKEKQFNIQVKLNAELKRLKQDLEKI